MHKRVLNAELAWRWLLQLRRYSRRETIGREPLGLAGDGNDAVRVVAPSATAAWLVVDRTGEWTAYADIASDAAQLFDLYLPLCWATAARPVTVAHLGQSLDGRIATENGASYYVTGPENLTHLHRMRALCDVVIVGAGTVARDNPRLTTRRVAGPHPARVILDPRRRLSAGFTVFQDKTAPTVVFCERLFAAHPVGYAEVIGVPLCNGQLALHAVLASLRARGFCSVFVEGGGITVSHFLAAGLLDRLQLTVAPLLIGSGRPSITLPVIDNLNNALRPRQRRFVMGEDVLFESIFTPRSKPGEQVDMADRQAR